MARITTDEMDTIRARKHALAIAIERRRSSKWLLRLWSRFIKTRDAFRCLCCESRERIQAHHIIRRTRYPLGVLELGNGVTLCPECHRRVHAEFNGRPNLSMPLGAEQGDDIDEWSFLFGILCDDAARRGVSEDEFYHLGDEILEYSISYQGYQELTVSVGQGNISRIKFAHEIWRIAPESFYEDLGSNIAMILLRNDAK